MIAVHRTNNSGDETYYNTNYTYYTFVRMDWLRAVGYDHVPATYEEHKDAINKISRLA